MFLIIVELRTVAETQLFKGEQIQRKNKIGNKGKRHKRCHTVCCTVKITKNHVNNNGTKNGEINTTSMTLQPQNEIAAY